MDHGNWLLAPLVYLAAAVLAVPLARLLGLGAIIGYLVAGIAIGPFGLALVTDAQQILSFAEFGVVLMLFLVGLELEPRRDRYSCGGMVALTTPCSTLPGWVRQVNGVGLAVGGTGLGVNVAVGDGGGVEVAVGERLWEGEQAEIPIRSATEAVVKIA